MTVYIVIARNGWGDEWIDAVLSKEELAKEYIKNRLDKYFKDNKRIDELDYVRDCIRELSYDEKRELDELEIHWCRCYGSCPSYMIKAIEVIE